MIASGLTGGKEPVNEEEELLEDEITDEEDESIGESTEKDDGISEDTEENLEYEREP